MAYGVPFHVGLYVEVKCCADIETTCEERGYSSIWVSIAEGSLYLVANPIYKMRSILKMLKWIKRHLRSNGFYVQDNFRRNWAIIDGFISKGGIDMHVKSQHL